MFQTFPHARDFPIAWTLAAAVLGAGASCAQRFDPANARAQFSSKAQSMEGSEPTTADPHPSTNSPAPIAVATTVATTGATTGATNGVVPPVVAPSVAAPTQPEVLVVDSVIIPVPPSLPVESLLHEPADAQTTHEASRVLREASVSKWSAVRAHAIEASIRSPKLLAELVPAALDDENRGVRFVACMAIAEARMPTLANAVAPLLSDPSASVRAAAMLALSRCGRTVDFTPLAAMLSDNDPEIRANAYLVLGELGNPSATPLIRESLGKGMKLVNPLRVRLVDLAAAEALVKLGDENEIEPIRAALFAPPEQGELTVVAFDSVRRLHDEGSRPMLKSIISGGGS
ncbi:MAG: HEAT repeat domain-containing protein, partial [Planctomycetota bacterium]